MQIVLWGLCMLAGLVIMIINLPKSQVGVANDDAYYITLARSLLHADEFGLINFPGAPETANYPFGYPLLLAPLAAIFPTELWMYKILSILATLVNTSLIFWGWRWLSRGLSYWWGLGVSALYIFSLTTVDLSGRVMSEPVFLTFYLMAMLLAERQAYGKTSYWWSLWMAFSLTFLLYVRSIGIVLVFTILVYLVLQTRSRFYRWLLPTLAGMAALLVFVVATSPLKTADVLSTNYIFDSQAKLIARLLPFYKPPTSPELQPNQDQPVDPGETDDSQDSFGKLFYNYIVLGFEQHVGRGIRSALSPYPGDTLREKLFVEALGMPFLANLLGYFFAAVVVVGYIAWFKLEKITLFNLSSLIYFGALFLWLWKEPRFLYPILPQLFTGLLLGVKMILSLAAWVTHRNIPSSRPKFQSISLRAFVIIFCLLLISKDVRFTDSRQNVGVISSRTGWIRENTPGKAIVMSEYPVIDYLYSNRTTVRYPLINTPISQFCQYLESEQVNYVLVNPRLKWMEPRFIPNYSVRMEKWLPMLEELTSSHKLALIHAAEDAFIRVYRVSPEVSCTP